MSKTAEKIRGLIQAEGAMPLDAYMQLALNDPDCGYYRTRNPLGRRGDFITAPEISQVFGELIGLWAVDFWQNSGQAELIHFVELGPGRATLTQDAMRAAQIVPPFCQTVKIEFVETSPVLRQQQAANMAQSANVTWHDDINSLPKAPCIIIANEFFDALPIKQFIKTEKGWQERQVDWQNDKFVYTTKNCNLCDIDKVLNIAAYGAVQIGDVIEYNPIGQAIMAQSARHICTYGGALLVIDYGYSKPTAGDSLQAVKQHKPIDPLATPGEADLTAHVNFAALQTAAETEGAKTYGPSTQGQVLQQLGIEARFATLKQAHKKAGDKVAALIAAQHRLTAPEQMGALFKVLAITPPTAPIPAGFAHD